MRLVNDPYKLLAEEEVEETKRFLLYQYRNNSSDFTPQYIANLQQIKEIRRSQNIRLSLPMEA